MDRLTKSAQKLDRPNKVSRPRRSIAPAPNFDLERAALRRLPAGARIVGVDEVGRGPLAGPVVAAAAWLSEHAAERLTAAGLRDSKTLSEARRQKLAEEIQALCSEGEAEAALGAASAREIEALNILGATFVAMRRAIGRLKTVPTFALVDGDKAPAEFPPMETVVKGDSRSLSIAAAAILAKTVRDRAMIRLSRRWPHYGWESNAGYPTAQHRTALQERGASPHHRRTFRGATGQAA